MLTHLIFLLINRQCHSQVDGQHYSDPNLPAEELNEIMDAILDPENFKYEMHRKSLENALENILASARDSDYLFDDEDKRSIATLAKNGQLPSKEPETEMESLNSDENGHKRNIASMARGGLIGGKRNIQALAKQMQYGNGKRNIGSIFRNNLLPGTSRSDYGKRNVNALARDLMLPKYPGLKKFNGKHHSVPTWFLQHISSQTDGKRNIQALKNQVKSGRKKRDVEGDELLEPVFQNGPVDYEELLQTLNENFPYSIRNAAEKRFLGELQSNNPQV